MGRVGSRIRPVLLRYDQGCRRVRRRDVGVVVGPAILYENVPSRRFCRETGNPSEVARPPDEGPKWTP
jgi:hypothetical protein